MATAGVNIYYHFVGLDVYSTVVPLHVVPLLSVRLSTPGRHPKTSSFDVAEGRI